MRPLNIAVVGGGVGGPCAAIALAQNSHHVTLYDRATSTDGVGFAFRITPNSDRCLRFLGIDTMDGGAVAANTGRLMNWKGDVIAEFRENTDPEKAKKGASVFAYRPSLQQQVYDRVKEVGVAWKTGAKVTSVDVETTTLTFEDGSTVTADLIIAADGVHSTIRSSVVDSRIHHPKLTSGHNCLRFTVPKQRILDDPVASKTISDDFRMFSWKGDEKRIIAYAVDDDRQYNFNCTHPQSMSQREMASTNGDGAKAIAYDHPISPSRVKEIYSEFDPSALRLLELADPEGLRVWNLLDMDDLPQWSTNRTVLIGDACHPVLPYGFSGASMAIEDAVTLAILLGEGEGKGGLEPHDIEARLKLFESLRRPRVARVRATSRTMSNSEDVAMVREYRTFLSEFDVVEHARAEVAKYLGGK